MFRFYTQGCSLHSDVMTHCVRVIYNIYMHVMHGIKIYTIVYRT